MPSLTKRPVVIQDIINYATYISTDNLDAGDRFIYATEDTFRRLANMPAIGKFSGFTNPKLVNVRQYPVKGFKNYLVFYQIHPNTVEVLRVLQGSQNLEFILEQEITE
jgi:toxin ParE1/3/4